MRYDDGFWFVSGFFYFGCDCDSVIYMFMCCEAVSLIVVCCQVCHHKMLKYFSVLYGDEYVCMDCYERMMTE